ncbi:MAG TPA: hypothetical protein VLC91_02450, partial [Spongiibacteraceae bacterium]|nr:hypothetical protein [Spongiibacteraceae bacterium]
MNFARRQKSAWFWLLCLIVLVVRVSGAHWHLCNDGAEPPQAVHAWDGAVDDKTEPGHSDINLNLVDDSLSKNLVKVFDLPALLTVVALLCILHIARRSEPIRYRLPI